MTCSLQRIGFFALQALLVSTFLAAGSCLADEWNDSFSTPRPYRVLRDIAVRGGPGNKNERLGSVGQGKVLQVREIINGWHRFDFDGKQGWIFKRYLRPMAAGEPEVPAKPEPAPKKPEPQSKKGTPSQQVDKAQEPAHAEAKDTRSPENDAVAQALAELSKERPLPETPEEPPVKDWTEATPKEQAPALSEKPAIGKQADTPPAPPNLEEAEETPPQEEETEVPEPQALREHETNPAPSSREEDAPMVASIDPGTELKPKRKILKAPASDSDMGNTCTRYQSIIPEESSKGVLFAAIEGHVEPGQKACLRILALKDWHLAVWLNAPEGVSFEIFTPEKGRIATSMRGWAHHVKVTGDKLFVITPGDSPADYTFSVETR